MEGVCRAGDTSAAGVAEDVGIDHGRFDIFMAEELLDGADIVAGDQQMGGEAVPEGVAADLFADTSGARGGVDGFADDRLVQVVAADDSGTRVDSPF